MVRPSQVRSMTVQDANVVLPPPNGHRPTALLNMAHVIHARRPKTGDCLRTDNILECVFEFIISKFIIFIEK